MIILQPSKFPGRKIVFLFLFETCFNPGAIYLPIKIKFNKIIINFILDFGLDAV